MLKVELGLSTDRLVPDMAARLQEAGFAVEMVAADTVREKGAVRVLTPADIAHATCRDIIVDYRDAAPHLARERNGFPARVAFGAADRAMGIAFVAELLRPAGLPAVGDADSATLMRLARRIAQSDATVLIQGETGTGKEGMARFVHLNSQRANRDFIAVNCAALPETMMEAMLFGHKKGSFTGASNASEGLFLAADGGTLFLDEIAELPLALQAKLLRALQEGEILPVGATHPVPVNVRVIAAGNRDLAAECEAGRFRSDLYWRLNVMPLNLKPLAQRRDDIRAIAAAILLRQQAAQEEFAWPTAAALERLTAHGWPGNARELGNVLQRALVLREGVRIEADDLHIAAAPVARAAEAAPAPVAVARAEPIPVQPVHLRDVARRSKLDAVRAVLREVDGHRALAARRLGISERTLRYRLAEMREPAAA